MRDKYDIQKIEYSLAVNILQYGIFLQLNIILPAVYNNNMVNTKIIYI